MPVRRWLPFVVTSAVVAASFGVVWLAPRERGVDQVDEIVASLLDLGPGVRGSAAEKLGGTYPSGARAVPALMELRRDEDAGVRAAAERSLRRLAEAGFVDAADLIVEEVGEDEG